MATIASYLPESQIITLSKDFPALSDPENLAGFTNPVQFGVFFHEWIHFLHNISTINGFSLFCTQITLWSNFRWAMDNQDVCIGSCGMDQGNIEFNKRFYSYIYSNRKLNTCGLPTHVKVNDLSFESAKIHDMEVADDSVVCTSLIKCTIIYSESKYKLDIGVLEILESAAFMLECKCISAMNGSPQEAPFHPYHTIKWLAGEIAPSLNEEDIICCMLSALQSNNPPHVLFNLLKESETLHAGCRYENLVSHVKKQLNEQDETISNSLSQIYSMFPIDEPMGKFIKLTLDRINKNLIYRKENPFFELDIIKKVTEKTELMNEIIQQFGACTIIQEKHEDDERPQCDIMYDFALPENDELTLFGSKMLRTCFHFIFRHYKSSGEIIKTESLVDSLNNKCPFYTVCCSSIRTSNSNVCSKSPWKSMRINDNESCYYAAAIKATNPPA
ncbi:hypothetical protein ACL2XQ_09725 [Sodalis sp. RH14]|uniref:hypothetical protein n=1 Tax=Sodalis sp. RH14 TaxID=3394329 RepID=UPI0039B67E19